MSLSQPKRILIIKLRHHGDVLLTTPVADAVKQHFPDCEIDMLVYSETADIIRDNNQFAQIFTIDRQWKKLGTKARLLHEYALFRQLKARNYDWAFNLSDQWRAALIAKLCAKCTVGFSIKKRNNIIWKKLHDFLNPVLDVDHHIVEAHLAVLPPLVRPDDYTPRVRMEISPKIRNSLHEKLRAAGWQGQDYVLMHPGSRWMFKCWEDGRNAALVQLLLNHGQNVVLTAAPSADEQKMLAEILARLNIPAGSNVCTLSGNLNLRELAAAIDGAKLFIGVDSVPMHIAAALDKPQIALFGPSWVNRWRPYSDKATVIWAGDFSELPHPDSIHTDDKTRLLKAITLEAVWEKTKEKLGL
ncbi:putative lipopolysaccharide heptosyltransferase III [Neisseria chenwenguii]|uniref:Putative lipopolysaccharide heptosyltransferase III n=1 Tax=Neisseria chenwenguii TaxID=1853278 RepID=A0A220S281_9NEIS|nr:putative lipopolysaccharide heptosyltransferase III [Neisseria chenwenguii]ASK27600.1 putative lipopolysaccharide heptosyltransferase III [Neisseria chenwenguii]ROV55513.1 putative lipopolysaccharide heptosyltransferase III [Neisseria chenwenguii]